MAIHEELRRGQSDEAFEEVTVVGQGDHATRRWVVTAAALTLWGRDAA